MARNRAPRTCKKSDKELRAGHQQDLPSSFPRKARGMRKRGMDVNGIWGPVHLLPTGQPGGLKPPQSWDRQQGPFLELKSGAEAGLQWLMHVTLATQEGWKFKASLGK
jgi:hypothetical protein